MKAALTLILFMLLIPFTGQAQCFEIESILVDACDGGNEGKNEMVQFKVGATALNTANLNINWPNNSYLGICQNATTTAAVAQINATILGCGLLVEPVGGVLPANSNVLLISSVDFNPLAQSFTGLTTTLVTIFQCPGNTAGHFANYTAIITPSIAIRTLSMSFSSPPACSDVVSYNRNNLLNQAQNPGAQDGGAVQYDPAGNPTYINNGCTAPFIPLGINASVSSTTGVTCIGMPVNLTATVTGGTYNSITWAGGTGTFAATTTTNTTNTYSPSNTEVGVISLTSTVTRTCAAGSQSASTTFTFFITPTPTVSFASPSATICPSQNATFIANTNANVFNWSSGQTTSSIVVSPTVNTLYTFTASNGCGQAVASVSVNSIPIPGITLASSSNTLCNGGTATLTANASTGTYTWSNGSNSNNIVVSPSVTTVYTASTANTCSLVSQAQTITVTPTSTVSFAIPSATICPSQSATFIASTNGTVFSWSSGQTTNSIVVSPTVNTVYTFTSSNGCGQAIAAVSVTAMQQPTLSLSSSTTTLCAGSAATLLASSSEGTYTWSTGSSTSSLTVSPSVTTNYTVSTANSCSITSAMQTISVINVPTVSLNNTLFNSCPSQTVNLIANTNGTSFVWSTGATTSSVAVSPTVNTVYSFTSSNICFQAVTTATVNIPLNPTLNVSVSSNTLCNGNSATITANASTGNYLWSTGATTSSIVISPANTGSYSVSSTNSCAVTVTAVQTISVFPNPIVSVSVLPAVFCNGQTATISTGLNSSNYNFSWSGPSLTGITNAASTQLNGGGTYSVTVTDNVTGCYGSGTLLVQPSIVTASFTANPVSGPGPLTVNFTNQSSGANTFGWNFGNVPTSSSVNPSTTFSNPGTYVVTLISSISGNCSDTYTLLITVEEGLGPVPEVITPNGDGKNDVFEIKGLDNYPNNNLQIYNRWGNPVYNSKPYKNNWDGVPNAPGKTGSGKLPAGTYYYLLELGDNNNTYFKGFVEVVY
ncbi:MAG: hypothetical protein JWO32_2618 [Bacteroidetes bacterium]|nr:hypothetical protein [Bacteroidota bacterium]